ncbi:glucose-6-phosphate exchanger SLC37A2-like [Saccoglossus kowalevskii]|uniref:Sugar phosphate exchanger 3 n=1 Tax=Saccoglossus kowalevskii TaxID=10224 RepID=A0ABM0MI86_SACKO|nr:PREDICTED: sugar phosphate exchanger 2-like [Saccoglossus kowalevskii]
MALRVPLGIQFWRYIAPSTSVYTRDNGYRLWVIILTFLGYTSYHLSRKPISVVKSILNRNCSVSLENDQYIDINAANHSDPCWCCWAPFDKDNAQELLGSLDYAYLFSYAIAMFFSGHIGERMNLRHFLTIGMLMSGLFTALFGFGYFWNIHNMAYYLVIQIIGGAFQSTGWPSMVAVMGNWFGKGRRGLIMGLWNSHTSVGNILGSLIAGAFVDTAWGLSFIIPGIIIASMGVITFFFLVVHPADVGCSLPEHGDTPIDDASSPIIIRNKATPEKQKPITTLGALRIPGVIEYSLCLFFAKLVSYTFLFWLPLYIKNKAAHFTDEQAADLSTFFDVGGIIGGILSGVVSDRLGGRACTVFISLLIGAPMMFIYNYFGHIAVWFNIIMLILSGIFINGPYALITTAVAADLGTHPSLEGNSKALSTVTAIIDGTGSIGAALGPLLTGVINPYGWNNVFYMLIAADLTACVFMTRLVIRELKGWCCSPQTGYVRSEDREPLLTTDILQETDKTDENGTIQ